MDNLSWLTFGLTSAGMLTGTLWFIHRLAVRPMQERLDLHSRYHQDHYASNQRHSSQLASLQRQMDDHADVDRIQFDAITTIMTEIRNDIKRLLESKGRAEA